MNLNLQLNSTLCFSRHIQSFGISTLYSPIIYYTCLFWSLGLLIVLTKNEYF
ncbi:transmembrane protein, putative [Medicago truncatula]|uniref:Transmembrane protein, putative n=1 Tax=Medicago truncatula TaxID=3880 RepID=G7KFM1_MEDTR|nr:transmembrane protein, putative [Medicago truncatula]